jgi:hypothetical protein
MAVVHVVVQQALCIFKGGQLEWIKFKRRLESLGVGGSVRFVCLEALVDKVQICRTLSLSTDVRFSLVFFQFSLSIVVLSGGFV